MTTADNGAPVRIPPLMTRDKYGKEIDSLSVGSYIVIDPSYREKALNYTRRKFKHNANPDDNRVYSTVIQDGETRLFRLK